MLTWLHPTRLLCLQHADGGRRWTGALEWVWRSCARPMTWPPVWCWTPCWASARTRWTSGELAADSLLIFGFCLLQCDTYRGILQCHKTAHFKWMFCEILVKGGCLSKLHFHGRVLQSKSITSESWTRYKCLFFYVSCQVLLFQYSGWWKKDSVILEEDFSMLARSFVPVLNVALCMCAFDTAALSRKHIDTSVDMTYGVTWPVDRPVKIMHNPVRIWFQLLSCDWTEL